MTGLVEIGLLPPDPAPQSAAIMEVVDTMPKPFRALVYEYGFFIVKAMIDDGARDAKNLERDLKTWRRRRQAGLLA